MSLELSDGGRSERPGGVDRDKSSVGGPGVEVGAPIANNRFELFYRFQSVSFQPFADQTQRNERNGRDGSEQCISSEYELYHKNTYSACRA